MMHYDWRVCFNEPGFAGDNVLHCCTVKQAIEDTMTRHMWHREHGKPNLPYLSDEKLLDEYMILHWAWFIDEDYSI